MFSTGSKLFFGLTASAVAALFVFGFFQNWNPVGIVGLGAAVFALAFLGGVAVRTRDADVPVGDASAAATSAAAAPAAGNSLWPLVAAVGGGLIVVGLVTDKRWFVGGLAVAFVALLEWMVQGWAERASGDSTYNRGVRGFMLHPIEMPVFAAIGTAVLVFAFSRIMLRSDTTVGPSLFIAIAALVTVFGFVLAARRRPSRSVVAGVCSIGAVALLAGGIWAAADGEHPELAEHAKVFRSVDGKEPERAHCGEEITEADHKAPGSVSHKSNLLAEVILRDNRLFAVEFGGAAVTSLVVPRGTTVSIMFKNENDDHSSESEHAERRLAASFLVNGVDGAGRPTTDLAQKVICTNAIEEGKVQLLTFAIPKPSAAAPEGKEFKFYVPGIEGAELPIEVYA